MKKRHVQAHRKSRSAVRKEHQLVVEPKEKVLTAEGYRRRFSPACDVRPRAVKGRRRGSKES